MKPLEEEAHHTKEELKQMLVRMRAASTAFYMEARAIGNHAFIEFTGLMNEYINVCEAALANGQDFTTANTHSGKALPMEIFHVMYLAEKLNCIYGPSLADAKLARAFVESVTGNPNV